MSCELLHRYDWNFIHTVIIQTVDSEDYADYSSSLKVQISKFRAVKLILLNKLRLNLLKSKNNDNNNNIKPDRIAELIENSQRGPLNSSTKSSKSGNLKAGFLLQWLLILIFDSSVKLQQFQ